MSGLSLGSGRSSSPVMGRGCGCWRGVGAVARTIVNSMCWHLLGADVTWLSSEGAEEILARIHEILRPVRAGAVWIA